MAFKHPRIYFPELPREGTISITGENYIHLRKSVRLDAGDTFCLFNGKGLFANAIVENITMRGGFVKARIIEWSEVDNTPPVRVTLAFGLLPPKPLSVLLAGTTQLGVESFRPFKSEYNDIKVHRDNVGKLVERWEKIIIENCGVAGRSHLPTVKPFILPFIELAECISDAAEFDYRFAFWEEGGKPLGEFLPLKKGRILVVTGPKGGLHEGEIMYLKAKNFEICTLGDLILKAEFAAISACARVIGS